MSDWPWDIYCFFNKAVELTRSSLWYEMGNVDEYLDFNKRAELTQRLVTARDKALEAWGYARTGNAEKAIALYIQIFGDKFPQYGG